MYYGGHPSQNSKLSQTTMLGVATSNDGITWNRRNAGSPIIRTYKDVKQLPSTRRYGAGQPSAIYLDGYVYLAYSDSTGQNSNPINGGGIYVIRSRDPLFQDSIEELTANGFVARSNAQKIETIYKIYDAYSVDWQYSDLLSSFLLGVNGVATKTAIVILDKSLLFQRQLVWISNINWAEGPGMARQLDGHTLPHGAGAPNRITMILFYPTALSGDLKSWDIGYTGIDFVLN